MMDEPTAVGHICRPVGLWWHCMACSSAAALLSVQGNLQIHQVHVGQDGQVLRGAQLIAVASADPGTAGVEGSPLQASDIQVQYVQLAPVTEHGAAVQGTEPLATPLQTDMEIKHESIQVQQNENGEVVQLQMPVNTVGT
ncbi:hypothetical protein JZ751_019408 [Albula glossodonta]|uniref:Uncharacterized protein n=1 Tax=Albula glossodonta TaxID=121402 RepID=A0A8T2NNW0_9TELE|nr:hypothetical protein JZ751_019408 [Albula glossodonta]